MVFVTNKTWYKFCDFCKYSCKCCNNTYKMYHTTQSVTGKKCMPSITLGNLMTSRVCVHVDLIHGNLLLPVSLRMTHLHAHSYRMLVLVAKVVIVLAKFTCKSDRWETNHHSWQLLGIHIHNMHVMNRKPAVACQHV